MAGIAPEVLVLCQESAFGTPVVTGGNVDYTLSSTFVVPTPQSNGFQADFKPNLQEIPFGGGFDVCVDVVASTYETKATFSTYGYPALTAFLLNAACVQVDSGGTSPWSTTEPQYDLASIAAFHAVRMTPLSSVSVEVRARPSTGATVFEPLNPPLEPVVPRDTFVVSQDS